MKKILLLILSLTSICFLESCQKTKPYSISYFDYFDTITTIIGYEKNQKEFIKTTKMIEEELAEYHKLYDIYYEYQNINNICTINKSKNPLVVDQKIIDLLLYGKQIYEKTNGMTNIALGSVLKLWHDEREYATDFPSLAKIPEMDLLQDAASHTNIDDVIIDEKNKTVYLQDEALRLDVGAIAKGYVAERITEKLQQLNKDSYILNIGGNIRLVGYKPHNEPFNVGIKNPFSQDENIQIISLGDYAVVTSGSYQRYFEVNGIRYHHIINPKTLMPENLYTSVTVVCKDSGLADGLSTALFSLSIEDGKKIISSLDDTYVMWITNNQQIIYSDGFNNFIKGGNNESI